MKKLLLIFLIGQLLLLSYMFNQSVYQIYELNSLGDSSLKPYKTVEPSGTNLNNLYNQIRDTCLVDKECDLQLIKTPISEHNHFTYDIYHSQVESINKPKSIASNKSFKYHQLTKEDFVDGSGIFYSNIPLDTLANITDDLGIAIESYNDAIEYSQIIKYNAINFFILLIISQLILFIYSFTRIKINTVKKVLGYSELKMIGASMKDFIYMESIILAITLSMHYIYYLNLDHVVPRYFYLLLVFLIIVILTNIIMLLFTQISLKFIDINLMIKNKVYSKRLNYGLYTIKILLILTITVSTSLLISNYKGYTDKLNNLEEYKKLENYFTSNGYNADEYTKANNNPKLLEEYGDSVKKVYDYFNESNQVYVHDVSRVIQSLSVFGLERRGLKKEDIYADIENNYIVVNERYLRDFMVINNEKGKEITDFNTGNPTILVPVKYKPRELEIKKIYTELYNDLLIYNDYYGLTNSESTKIDNLSIIYINDKQEFELLGKNINEEGSSIRLKDTIVILDQGDFGSLYYFDQLNNGGIIFHLEERNEFSKILGEFNLTKIVNVGTLLTPFMTVIYSAEFLMYNTLVFTLLFLFTLIFVIYISNYVDVTSNSKRYAIQTIYGYDLFKTFKSHIIVYIVLLSAIFVNLFIEFNTMFYILMLIIDFIMLLLLYKIIIKKNINKIVKGG